MKTEEKYASVKKDILLNIMGLEESISHTSLNILIGAGILLVTLTALALQKNYLNKSLKNFLFGAILLVVLLPTIFMIVSTIYLNTVSASNGPVHWHADFELWSCGREINLKDPVGLSNKIGTPSLHEHNDKRIHLEGVVVHPTDASLGKFFQVIGGEITESTLVIPTNTGVLNLTNGSMCPNGQQGQVQVFVYHVLQDGTFMQTKVINPQNYTISPETSVPNGDCIIVTFGEPQNRTDKLCRSYKVAQEIGKLKGEKYGN